MAKKQQPLQPLFSTTQQTEENRQLLYEEIYKQFMLSGASPEDGATSTEELMLKHIANLFGLQGLAVSIGALSIPFFCRYFLQDTFIPKKNNTARELAPIHLEMWEELDQMFLQDAYDKIVVAWPRGCAKTTVLNFALTVWLHAYKKSIYTLVAGKNETDSVAFISQTRQAFEENDYLLAGFGKMIKPNDFTVNKLEIELTNKTKIQAISSTSSMRGKKYGSSRPSCVISDDYQGRSDIITQESRDKKYDTFIQDTGFCGDKAVFRDGVKIRSATKFVVLGTVLHRDCYLSRLLLNKDYKHFVKRVVDFDVDEYFHTGLWEEFNKIFYDDKRGDSVSDAKEFFYQHEKEMKYSTVWDSKYLPLDTALDYYNSPIAFRQELCNDASRIGERWFTSVKSQTPDEIEEHTFIKTCLVCDPASSVSVKSDYSAFCVGSIAENNFTYVRKGIIAKLKFDDFCKKVVELLKIYTDISHISIERNLYSGADVLKIRELVSREPELKNRGFVYLNAMQRKNKDEKISTIAQQVNSGQIIFNVEDEQPIGQLLDFCGQLFSAHDDFPDVVSQMTIDIKEINVIGRVTFMDRKLLGI